MLQKVLIKLFLIELQPGLWVPSYMKRKEIDMTYLPARFLEEKSNEDISVLSLTSHHHQWLAFIPNTRHNVWQDQTNELLKNILSKTKAYLNSCMTWMVQLLIVLMYYSITCVLLMVEHNSTDRRISVAQTLPCIVHRLSNSNICWV